MKRIDGAVRILVVGLLVALVLAGCGGGDDSVTPPDPSSLENWDFPADTSKFALTMIAPDTAVIGEQFDVDLVVYNARQLFGAAARVRYERDRVRIENVILGPVLGSTRNTLGVAFVDSAQGQVEVASTLRAGAPIQDRVSGVLCRLRCRGLRSGRVRFRVDGDITLRNATGDDIAAGIRREEGATEIRP